jgi:NAD(P)-dependent dehydrogenase (short-subunit alcohol dehydrogenase family)
MEAAQWDQVISTHVNALFNCTQPVAKHLSARYKNDPNDGGGSIICMSSTSGLAGNVGQCNYGAAKAAVLGFVLSLAKEAGRYGARVNAVVPSAWTRLTSAIPEAVLVKHVGEAALQDMKARRPEHIAPIVGYLASTAAEGVTGQIVRASGNRLGLFSRPAEIDSVYTESAWTAESVAQAFDQSLRSQLDPLTSLGDL